MTVCDQCGSMSRDKSGFCAGCGAPWPLALPDAPAKRDGIRLVSLPVNLPENVSSFGLLDVGQKQVWIAVVLALLVGPLGLLYCTTTGTVVMLIVSIPLALFLGKASLLIIQPICAIWAWRAARDLSSSLD